MRRGWVSTVGGGVGGRKRPVGKRVS